MYAIKIEVIGNIARVTERPARITAGTVGLPVVFSFDSQWDKLSKTAVFRAGNVEKIRENLENETTVPWEVLATPNEWLSIGVYGVNADGTVAIPTVWANVRIICDGANTYGDVSAAPSLPIWQKILNSIGNLLGLTTNAKSNLVEAINEVHNIALAGGIETDKTLSESGKAAEAKATGDAMHERVSKSGDTMNGELVLPKLIVKNDTFWQSIGMKNANRPEVEADVYYSTDEDGTVLYFGVHQNGKSEYFLLPRYDADRTTEGWYPILTTKKAVAVEEGGTGARDAATARANLGVASAEYAKKVGNPHNLLDNSDFRNPVNQRGFTENTTLKTKVYVLDRWMGYPDVEGGRVTLTNDGLEMVNATLIHHIPAGRIKQDNKYTLAIYFASGHVTVAPTQWLEFNDRYTKLVLYMLNGTVTKVALYEGEYTTETLPEYQPKGYGAELVECMRYYRRKYASVGNWDSDYASVNFDIPMRSKPTVTILSTTNGPAEVYETNPNYFSVQNVTNGLNQILYEASADL